MTDLDWARLRVGDPAVFTTDAYPSQTFHAKVKEIADAADPATGTFMVKLQVLPSATRFASGLVAKTKVEPIHTEKVQLIPMDALVESNEKTGNVFTLNSDGKTVKKHEVQIVNILENEVAIANSLNPASRIITAGGPYLADGSTVSVAKTN